MEYDTPIINDFIDNSMVKMIRILSLFKKKQLCIAFLMPSL